MADENFTLGVCRCTTHRTLSSAARAQVFVNDNDGLLDVGEALGFTEDPSGTTGSFVLSGNAVEDLLTNVSSVSLHSNLITSIEEGDFDGLSNLEPLFLARAFIASIEERDFSELVKLEQLYVSDNDRTIIAVEDFGGLTNLKSLKLQSNHIRSIESGAFEGLNNLESLDLSGNDLSELNLTDATFENLQFPGFFCDNPTAGFWIDSDEISSLILDGAQLSVGSLDAIVFSFIRGTVVDVLLVGLTFAGEDLVDLNT